MRKLFYGFIAMALVLSIPSTTFATYLTDKVKVTKLREMTENHIPFGQSDGSLSATSEMYWDSTNKRLGIGTGLENPDAALHVGGGMRFGDHTGTDLEGMMKYDGNFKVFNGTKWIIIDGNDDLQAAIDANTTAISTNLTTLEAADDDLQAQITSNDTDISGLQAADTALQDQITSNDGDITGLTAATGATGAQTWTGTNYIDAATTLKGAIDALDSGVATAISGAAADLTDLEARVTTNEGDIDSLEAADVTIQADIDANETASDAADAALQALIDTNIANITSNDGDITGLTAATGATGAQTWTGTNYIDAATTLKGAIDALDSGVATAISGATADLTTLEGRVTVNEGDIDALEAADVTLQTNIDTNTTAISTNLTAMNTADAALQALIDTNIANITSNDGDITALQAADTTLQTNIDGNTTLINTNAAGITALQTLTNGIASVVSSSDYTGSNYLTAATSLKDADVALDAAIKVNEGLIGDNAAAIAALDTDMDAYMLTADFNTNLIADTSFIAAQTGISTNATDIDALEAADVAIQADIDANEAAMLAADTTLQGNIDANTALITANATDITGLDGRLTTAEGTIVTHTGDISDLTAATGATGAQTWTGTNYIDAATTLLGAIEALDTNVATAITGATTDLTTLEGRVTVNEGDIDALEAADIAIQADIDANETASDDADAALQALIDTNIANITSNDGDITALQTADTTLQGNIDANTALITTNTGDISTNAAGIEALQTLTNGIASVVSSSDYTGSNYLTAATSLKDADVALDAAIKVNEGLIGDNAAAIAALDTDMDAYMLTADFNTNLIADTSFIAAQTGISTNATDIDALEAADVAIQADIDANEAAMLAADTTLQTNIDANTALINTNTTNITSNDTDIAGLTAATGATGAQTWTGTNYIDAATTLLGAIEALDSGVATAISGATTDLTALTTRVTTNEGDIDALEAADVVLQTNIDTNTTAISTNLTAMNTADAALQADIDANEAAMLAADTTLQGNIDTNTTSITALQTLTNGIASVVSSSDYTGSNYLTAATSLKDADVALDAQIKINEGLIAALDTDMDAYMLTADFNTNLIADTSFIAAEADIATNETNIALNSAVIQNNAADIATNAADIATNATDIATNTAAIASNLSTLQAADSALDTAKADKVSGATAGNLAGLDASGNLTDSGFAMNDAGTTTSDLWSASKIATEIAAGVTNITGNETAFDGWDKDASDDITTSNFVSTIEGYATYSGTTYLDAATTLLEADAALDAAINTNAGLIAANTTSIGTNAGNISANSAAITANGDAITALQTADTEMQTATGIAAGESAPTWTAANYLTANTIVGGVLELDGQIKTNEDAITANATAITNLGTNYVPYTGATGDVNLGTNNLVLDGTVDGVDVSDLAVDVTTLETLTGVAGAADLGTFTGTTIADASDVKTALQALETSTEANASDIADLDTNKVERDVDAVVGNLARFIAGGDIEDSGIAVLDEDDMASDSDTAVPTQQSVKAFVASEISANLTFVAVSGTTYQLPAASTMEGKTMIVKDTTGNAGTLANNIIVTSAGGTMDGETSLKIEVNYGVLNVYSDGTNWFTF